MTVNLQVLIGLSVNSNESSVMLLAIVVLWVSVFTVRFRLNRKHYCLCKTENSVGHNSVCSWDCYVVAAPKGC